MFRKRHLLILLATVVFSLSSIAAAQTGQIWSLSSDSDTLTIEYPTGWVLDYDQIIVLASSEAAQQASADGDAIPAGELVFTILQPGQLTEGGMSPTIDPTEAVETMIGLGEFLGRAEPYNVNGVAGASAMVRSMEVIYGQIVALGFDGGTVVVLVEAGSPPGELAATIDQVIGGIGYVSEGSAPIAGDAADGAEPAFLWMVSAPTGDTDVATFGDLHSVAVAADRSLYVFDADNGIWQIDPVDGSVIGQIQPQGLFFSDDLDVDPATGNLYIASWSEGSIFVVTPEGEVLDKIGSTGPEDGQFGTFSPQTVVIHNGELYASDGNKDAEGNGYSRIQVFGLDGSFLRAIDTTDITAFEPEFDVAPDGYLYVGGFGTTIGLFAPDGTLIDDEIGGGALFGVALSGIDVAEDGTVFVASWHDGFMLLTPEGEITGQYGVRVSNDIPDSYTPSIGEYLSPTGIAVSSDGIVYMTDNFNGKASALTALTLNGAIVPPGVAQSQVTQVARAAEETRQWASAATGSSQYGSDSWSFAQATGAPNTSECADRVTAWASSSSTGRETLALEFEQAVLPSEINVYQTYNPGSITRVELTNTDDSVVLAVPDSADPPGNTPCPGVFTLDVSNFDVPVNGVILYFDQSIGGSWNEIDAVELVGTLASGASETSGTSAFASATFGNLTLE